MMEASYGIGVHNRYALFLEDGEDDSVDPYSLMNASGIGGGGGVAIDHQTGGDSLKKGSTTTSATAKLSSNQKGHQQQQQQQQSIKSSSAANVNNKQSSGTLTESKQQNVMTNVKSDSGKIAIYNHCEFWITIYFIDYRYLNFSKTFHFFK